MIDALGKNSIRLYQYELRGDSLYSVYDFPDSLGSFGFLMQDAWRAKGRLDKL
jgi:hypothetical protein